MIAYNVFRIVENSIHLSGHRIPLHRHIGIGPLFLYPPIFIINEWWVRRALNIKTSLNRRLGPSRYDETRFYARTDLPDLPTAARRMRRQSKSRRRSRRPCKGGGCVRGGDASLPFYKGYGRTTIPPPTEREPRLSALSKPHF